MADNESPPQAGPNEASEWLRSRGFVPDAGSSRWNGPAGEVGRVTDRIVTLGTEPKPWRGLRWFATVSK